MNTVLRYVINNTINDVDLPVNYKVLNAGIAKSANGTEEISIWCQVEVNNDYRPYDTKKVRFLVFGTGANMDSMLAFNPVYIGTVQKSNMYAFHIFKVDNI